MTPGRDVRRNIVLAALASYIDAGSIVAGAAGLPLWADKFGLGSTTLGLIAAFSSNAISAGIGALVGGWLCDRFGRRRVYQSDLLLYAFGLLWIVFATAPWMLITGYVFAGLAVGADVPASWTLIAEIAPARKRGRYGATAQLLWSLGPMVVLALALALSGLGVLGIRIIFAHLFVVSLVLWALRRRMHESPMWEDAKARTSVRLADVRRLVSRPYLPPLLFLAGMYGFWNLKAGTSGFFLPYILRTAGSQSQAASVALQAVGFVLGSLGIVFVFMRFVDRTNQRRLLLSSLGIQIAAMLLFVFFPLTTFVAITYVVLSGLGGGFGPQAFFQLWSAELFPTPLRASALGLMFAVVRIGLGIWSLFVPAITAAGFHGLAVLLTVFMLVSAGLAFAFAPSNPGRSLDELHRRVPKGGTGENLGREQRTVLVE